MLHATLFKRVCISKGENAFVSDAIVWNLCVVGLAFDLTAFRISALGVWLIRVQEINSLCCFSQQICPING